MSEITDMPDVNTIRYNQEEVENGEISITVDCGANTLPFVKKSTLIIKQTYNGVETGKEIEIPISQNKKTYLIFLNDDYETLLFNGSLNLSVPDEELIYTKGTSNYNINLRLHYDVSELLDKDIKLKCYIKYDDDTPAKIFSLFNCVYDNEDYGVNNLDTISFYDENENKIEERIIEGFLFDIDENILSLWEDATDPNKCYDLKIQFKQIASNVEQTPEESDIIILFYFEHNGTLYPVKNDSGDFCKFNMKLKLIPSGKFTPFLQYKTDFEEAEDKREDVEVVYVDYINYVNYLEGEVDSYIKPINLFKALGIYNSVKDWLENLADNPTGSDLWTATKECLSESRLEDTGFILYPEKFITDFSRPDNNKTIDGYFDYWRRICLAGCIYNAFLELDDSKTIEQMLNSFYIQRIDCKSDYFTEGIWYKMDDTEDNNRRYGCFNKFGRNGNKFSEEQDSLKGCTSSLYYFGQESNFSGQDDTSFNGRKIEHIQTIDNEDETTIKTLQNYILYCESPIEYYDSIQFNISSGIQTFLSENEDSYLKFTLSYSSYDETFYKNLSSENTLNLNNCYWFSVLLIKKNGEDDVEVEENVVFKQVNSNKIYTTNGKTIYEYLDIVYENEQPSINMTFDGETFTIKGNNIEYELNVKIKLYLVDLNGETYNEARKLYDIYNSNEIYLNLNLLYISLESFQLDENNSFEKTITLSDIFKYYIDLTGADDKYSDYEYKYYNLYLINDYIYEIWNKIIDCRLGDTGLYYHTGKYNYIKCELINANSSESISNISATIDFANEIENPTSDYYNIYNFYNGEAELISDYLNTYYEFFSLLNSGETFKINIYRGLPAGEYSFYLLFYNEGEEGAGFSLLEDPLNLENEENVVKISNDFSISDIFNSIGTNLQNTNYSSVKIVIKDNNGDIIDDSIYTSFDLDSYQNTEYGLWYKEKHSDDENFSQYICSYEEYLELLNSQSNGE